jgi:hypothetical protein
MTVGQIVHVGIGGLQMARMSKYLMSQKGMQAVVDSPEPDEDDKIQASGGQKPKSKPGPSIADMIKSMKKKK